MLDTMECALAFRDQFLYHVLLFLPKIPGNL